MMPVKLVPATSELLHAYYGEREIPSTYAVVAVEADLPVAVAGLIRLPGGRAFLYSDAPRSLHKKYPKATMQATRRLLDLAEKRGWDVVAKSEDNEAARRFLEHFGFEKMEAEGYIKWAR